jgi:hypothetical protein
VVADDVDDEADLDGVEDGADTGPLPQWNPQHEDQHTDDLDHPAESQAAVSGNPLVEDIPRRQAEAGGDEHADPEAEAGQPGDASAETLDRAIEDQSFAHTIDATDRRVTPPWY